MNGLHGIIFSLEKFSGLRELTDNRMPASVPFAGRYRIIDFILSSMVNASITDVGVVLQGNYQSLLDHLGSGKDWDLSRKHGGLKLLPPFSQKEIRGRIEALAGVRTYLEGIRQSHVVLADSDLIINIPLEDVYQSHLASGADITAVCTSNTTGSSEDATYFKLDENGRVAQTFTSLRNTEGCHRALEIYILSKQLLLDLIDECISQDRFNFRSAILQAKVDTLNIGSYDSAEVADELSQRFSIATRPGAHCAPRMHYALGTQEQGAVRFSFSWFSTEEEVDAAIAAVKEIAEG